MADGGHTPASPAALAADAPDAPKRCYRFILYAHDEPDALVRVLNPFVVQQVRLGVLSFDRQPGGVCVQIEVENVAPAQAERLTRQLEAMPVVRTVGLGWRSWSAGGPL